MVQSIMRYCIVAFLILAVSSWARAADPALSETPDSATSLDQQDAQLAAALRLFRGGLTPEDVARIKEEKLQHDRAVSRVAPDKAVASVVPVSLAPGAKAPVVTVMHGFVSAIEVLDRTGQPWPILSVRTGDQGAFDVSLAVATDTAAPAVEVANKAAPAPGGSTTGNTITITPLQPYAVTNVVLMLAGESHPVSMIIKAVEARTSSVLRDRVTFLIGGLGPNAATPSVASYDHLDAGADLRNVLVGQLPVPGAHEVFGDWDRGLRIWRSGETLWLRTSGDTLINPAPTAAVSMGTVRAYKLPWLPVVVLSQSGKLRQVPIVPSDPLLAQEPAP